MSEMIAWIAAEADREPNESGFYEGRIRDGEQSESQNPQFSQQAREAGHPAGQDKPFTTEDTRDTEATRKDSGGAINVGNFPAHTFPRADSCADAGERSNIAQEQEKEYSGYQDEDYETERARRIYRGRTITMLRRYMRYSIETGRLPSLLGREFFRTQVTSYTVVTFEDRVIFVHDMEKCLERLDDFSRQIIARHILQEHDQAATGRLLHCTERTVRTYVPIVLDLLVEVLLEVGLLERVDSNTKKSCQGGISG
ncbi:MAG TPA: hypothetical protein VGG04_09290 [Candidatus Sulfotelmatobacter sp.]